MALALVWSSWRWASWLVAGAAVPLALAFAYNLAVGGNLAGGYGTAASPSFLAHPLWSGLAGLLVSPMRGLLVFSPFLLFLPLGLARRLREPSTHRFALLLGAGVLAQLVLYAKADWRMGFAWGPRWQTDMLPILLWMLAPAVLALRPLARAALVATMVASIAIQAIGAFWYTGQYDGAIFAGGNGELPGVWQPANAPFIAELSHPRQRGDLACPMRGYLDRIGPALPAETGAPVPVLASGAQLQGWALACGHTPADVLLLVDGALVGYAQRFAPRPDVTAAMHTTAPSAWTAVADTAALAPGEHVLEVAVRREPVSDLRLVSEHRVRIAASSSPSAPQAATPAAPAGSDRASELAPFASRAASLLREHQNAAGYWLTTFTSGPRFVSPGQEMNTFLTAMLLDYLAPVAREQGLEEVLAKARFHLTAQIESDGLVRYHGLPNGPTMGTLGCPITPDADDTALVWRLAPPPSGDPRRASMRRVLESYRDARGLYKTWLAPRERFQCLDPGKDPDPADVAIQMHVLLLLAGSEPDASQALCSALQGAVGDERIWVYYARAPLVPMLRADDLRGIGCNVSLPAERIAGVPGQENWIEVARRLVAATRRPTEMRPNDRQAASALLADLARDDFAALRRTPPLLYHNDLTATVSRYYWSEDFGYALWLRLYAALRALPRVEAPR
jgi:hypothetical protein